MFASAIDGQFADELAELHEGSVGLFVTLPIFRALVRSQRSADLLTRFEAMLGEHLAGLDSILGDTIVRRDRTDGALTRLLFRSICSLRSRHASEERDIDIIRVVEQAQLFLMGSCSFALRFARQARVSQCEQVLQESLVRIRSLALYLTTVDDRVALESEQTCNRAVSGLPRRACTS